jgi:hypothetical protein
MIIKNKMLIKALLICISFIFLGASSQHEEGTIIWGQREITWADFKGNPPPKSNYIATLKYALDMSTKNIKFDSINAYVYATMKVNQSWRTTDSLYQLNHERRHFDLVEIYARKMRKRYKETRFIKSTVAAVINKIYKEVDQQLLLEQKIYDFQTDHCVKEAKQAEWDKKIEAELKALETYSDPIVPLNVDWKR